MVLMRPLSWAFVVLNIDGVVGPRLSFWLWYLAALAYLWVLWNQCCVWVLYPLAYKLHAKSLRGPWVDSKAYYLHENALRQRSAEDDTDPPALIPRSLNDGAAESALEPPKRAVSDRRGNGNGPSRRRR